MSFREIQKKNVPNFVITQHFLFLRDKYKAAEFYTDASKTTTAVSCAANGPLLNMSKTMNRNTSIFTAEAYGILLALNHIVQNKIKNLVIYTDSLSVVSKLSSRNVSRNPTFNCVLRALYSAYGLKLVVTVCWVPGLCGIAGNEAADRSAAAAALRSSIDVNEVPYQDLKPFVKRKLRDHWQQQWEREVENKLHVVKPKIGKPPAQKHDRSVEVALCRLRIGHTHITHSYLLTDANKPRCHRCGGQLSVLHMLVVCEMCNIERKRHFHEIYTHYIPLHPSLFLSDSPMFSYRRVFNYLADVDFLKYISYSP